MEIFNPVRAAPRNAGVYLGRTTNGYSWADREQAVLVIGPPRSGKTSAIVIPSVLATRGAVVSTSTKTDVLHATSKARANGGPCLLYDPSGTVSIPRGVEPLHWSPISGSRRWDDATMVARNLVRAARLSAPRVEMAGGIDHWTERSEALISSLLHAAALGGESMKTVMSWVDRHESGPALDALEAEKADLAGNLLSGISATDRREQSGIWSTASGVLAAYRSVAALESTEGTTFDAKSFCEDGGTLYICATGNNQSLSAPLVVSLLGEVRSAVYAKAAQGNPKGEQVLFALDEVANIAPLPDLPAMVSEGGGQGLVTLACIQDLSQARTRWGEAAEGFLSIFGTTVVLAGIGDVRTLRAISTLAGEEEIPTRSVAVASEGRVGSKRWGRKLFDGPDRRMTITTSGVQRPRLAADVIARGSPGTALVIGERAQMSWVGLTPWQTDDLWRSAVGRTIESEDKRHGRTRTSPDREPGLDRSGPSMGN